MAFCVSGISKPMKNDPSSLLEQDLERESWMAHPKSKELLE